MKANTKLFLRNAIISSGLLLISCMFFWMFWRELNKSIQSSGGDIVGEIVAIKGQAQRRYASQHQWGNLRDNETVYNQDAIRTSSDANASIIIRSVSTQGEIRYDELELGPDTYIILDITENSRNISFIAGDIFAKGEDGLSIQAEGTVIDTDGTVRVTRKEGQSTDITALDGEARVNVNGQETLIDNESNVQIEEGTNRVTKKSNPVVLLTPAPNEILLSYNNTRYVDFSWELIENWTNTFLEVSLNSDFINTEEIERIKAEESASIPLSEGSWFWRIINEDTKEVSTFYAFSVRTEQKVTLFSPNNQQIIFSGTDESSVNFQWRPAIFAESHLLEISQSTDFNNPIISQETQGNYSLVNNLSVGEWWWRITPIYRRANIPDISSSQIYNFVIEERLQHETVSLLFPVDRSRITTLNSINGIDFRWKKAEGISTYKILIASDADFTQLIVEENLTNNWKKLNESPEAGTYYWKVEATALDNLPVPTSPVRTFEIQSISASVDLLSPSPEVTVTLEPHEPYTFIWKSIVPGTARFILQRQNGFSRTTIVENLVQAERFTMVLPGGGTYEWQVEILDGNQRSIVKSDKGIFNISLPLAAPTLVSPDPGEVIDLSGTRIVELVWTSIPEANTYNMMLKAPDGSIVDSASITDVRKEVILPSNANRGVYRVELSSEQNNVRDGEVKTSRTAIYSFQINNIISYNAAIPSLPRNGSVFQIVEATVQGISFRWFQQPQLARWVIELSNGQNTWMYQANTTTLNLKGLLPGSYSWVIHSYDINDQESPVSQVGRFIIQDYLVPASPVVTYPEAEQIVDMTGQTKLEFRWQSSTNQVTYDLTLRSEENEVILIKKGLTGTSFVLGRQDLRTLFVGNFILELVSYIEYPATEVIKKSQITRVPFSLAVNISKKAPKILTDELQYVE